MKLSAAQLTALAQVATRVVQGARDGSYFAFAVTETSLRRPTMQALLNAGLVAFMTGPANRWRPENLVVTPAGEAILADHPDVVAVERIRGDVLGQHLVRYEMYARGNHPIRGWGRMSMGCKVTCSCGWDLRVNEGRKNAEMDVRFHRFDKVNEALEAAGYPAEELDF